MLVLSKPITNSTFWWNNIPQRHRGLKPTSLLPSFREANGHHQIAISSDDLLRRPLPSSANISVSTSHQLASQRKPFHLLSLPLDVRHHCHLRRQTPPPAFSTGEALLHLFRRLTPKNLKLQLRLFHRIKRSSFVFSDKLWSFRFVYSGESDHRQCISQVSSNLSLSRVVATIRD